MPKKIPMGDNGKQNLPKKCLHSHRSRHVDRDCGVEFLLFVRGNDVGGAARKFDLQLLLDHNQHPTFKLLD